MLNFENHIPLHIQLKDLLKTEIVEGKYVEKIPSERELMERFTVSRSTVREAVKHLVHEGVLKKSTEKEHLSQKIRQCMTGLIL